MIDFISNWVKNIVYIIIFVVFLEILLPSNAMKKYVKVVAGLLIMLVILTPITQVFNKSLNFQDVISKNYVDFNQVDLKNQNILFEGQQSELTMKIYKDKISNQIKNLIEKNIEGINVEAEVEVFMDSENERYGEIKQVVLIIEEKENLLENEIKPIDKIEIGDTQKPQDEVDNEVPPIINKQQKREIKEYILDFYNVPIENISINIQRNTVEKEVQ